MEDDFMLGISKEKWREYQKRCLGERIKDLRKVTHEEAFELYEELYELAAEQEIPPALGEIRWKEKLAIRMKMLSVFRDMDRRRREEKTSKDAP